jgi:UDP-glucose 4-epimerase
MKKALVTGGAGFIGSHLAHGLLKNDYEVIVLDNESTGFGRNVPENAFYIKGDVQNKSDVQKAFSEGIDVVFHVAGQASTIKSFHDPLSDLRTNVMGTVNLLQMCLEMKVPRFLFASSMTCYGNPEKVPTAEDHPCLPISYYGITKYAAERYVHATAARNDLDFDFQATSFRMFNVYGERQSLQNPYQGVMAIFMANALNNEPINIHSDGKQSRDFIYIRDVVNAWIAAIDNPGAYGQVFNLGTGTGLSINRLVDLILQSNGKDRSNYPITHLPVRPGDQRHMKSDVTKAKTILDWAPVTPLETGMQKSLKWAETDWQKMSMDK